MATQTEISYADHTKSPWRGCQRVDACCTHCYVEAFQRKFHDKLTDRRLVASFESDVKRWNKQVEYERFKWASERPFSERNGERCPVKNTRVFVSLCDWLDDQVPIEWLADFLRVVHECQNLSWLLCTKRPENWIGRINKVCEMWACDGSYRETPGAQCYHDMLCPWRAGTPPANIWLGITYGVNNRRRMKDFLSIPAHIRWLSVEPILERIDLGFLELSPCIDWVVVGGESGPGRREAKGGTVEAIRNVVEQCRAASVPVWVKQDCHAKPGQQGRLPNELWNIKQLPTI